jgi:hypothetical protein
VKTFWIFCCMSSGSSACRPRIIVIKPRTSASAALLDCAEGTFIFGIGGAGMVGIDGAKVPLMLDVGTGMGAGIFAMFCGGGGGSGAMFPGTCCIGKGMVC